MRRARAGWWLGMVVAMGLAGGCRRSDVRTVRLHVPDMAGPACADVVVAAVKNVPGVVPASVSADTVNRAVTVSYESLQLSQKNIEFFIAEAGFRVVSLMRTPSGVVTTEVPASASARAALPAECRP